MPTKTTMTSDNRLMIPLTIFINLYRKIELNNITSIRSEFMLANPLTKFKPNHFCLKLL